jgi:undecaprenyl pyrophosphate phosphatase UppP
LTRGWCTDVATHLGTLLALLERVGLMPFAIYRQLLGFGVLWVLH